MLQLFDMSETGALELTSTIILVFQASRLTKCASHPLDLAVFGPSIKIIAEAKYDTFLFVLKDELKKKSHQS